MSIFYPFQEQFKNGPGKGGVKFQSQTEGGVKFQSQTGGGVKFQSQTEGGVKFQSQTGGGVKFQSQTGGGVKFQSQTGGGVKFQSPNAKPGAANAQPGGANTQPGGLNKKAPSAQPKRNMGMIECFFPIIIHYLYSVALFKAPKALYIVHARGYHTSPITSV